MPLGLLASGRGSNVAAILDAIEAGDLEAEARIIVCDRPRAAVLDIARERGVALALIQRSHYSDRAAQQRAIRDALQAAGADLVVLAGFASILDPVIVDAFPERILNIHPSLLPAFAGSMAPGPQEAALRAGVKLAGCTIHVVTNEVDAGPIVAQAAVPVLADDTVETLSERILAEEHRLYPTVLQWYAQGRVRIVDGRVVVAGD